MHLSNNVNKINTWKQNSTVAAPVRNCDTGGCRHQVMSVAHRLLALKNGGIKLILCYSHDDDSSMIAPFRC